MSPERFQTITEKFPHLRVAIVGDFCLDRYLEIDASKAEVSIETSLPVHNVVNVRSQPGGAGTILNNVSALGAETIFPVGFAGNDGEGFELANALSKTHGVQMDHFLRTHERRTFTYCKPLVIKPGEPPCELSRLDQKNWTPTPERVAEQISSSVMKLAHEVDCIILLSQVDIPDTGVVTSSVLKAVGNIGKAHPQVPILADSRNGFAAFPRVIFKMNEGELRGASGKRESMGIAEIGALATTMSTRSGQPVFVTLAERGMLAASPDGKYHHVAAMPIRGPIDIVGAGDAVTANLAVALASGATLLEAIELASAAASKVIHQLGTTGVASVLDLRGLVTF